MQKRECAERIHLGVRQAFSWVTFAVKSQGQIVKQSNAAAKPRTKTAYKQNPCLARTNWKNLGDGERESTGPREIMPSLPLISVDRVKF